jgi:hypothetical protein
MKAIRTLAAAIALFSLAPAAALAQTARPFQNSWWWGLKGGGTFTSSPSSSNVVSGMAGADWLITRDRGGIYMSFDQSFLSQSAVLADSVNSTDTPSLVRLKDLRRITVALMGYPGDWERFHPYVGLGMIYSQVGSVTPVNAYSSQDQYNLAQQIISAYKSVFTPMVMVGAQLQVRNAGLFVQAMGWQVNQQFFLSSSSHSMNTSIEVGLRYNFGNSRDEDR